MPRSDENWDVAGLSTDSLTVRAGRLGPDWFDTTSGKMKAVYVVHEFPITYIQNNGADVASATSLLFYADKPGQILVGNVWITTAPTGGDKAFTVDIQKSTGGAAFATILNSTVTVDNTDTNRTTDVMSLAGTSFVAGDAFQVVVATSGTTGSQGQGLLVQLLVYMAPYE